MIIIVDGYNLLRAIPPYKKTITEKERMQFIARLSAYGRRKGHKIIIVFDGGPYDWSFKENTKIVQVVYSGIHETADDYIKDYIHSHKAKDLLLVSSDSELNRYAEHLAIPSIDSSSFYDIVHQELTARQSSHLPTQQEQPTKMVEDDEQDLDKVMTEASKKVPLKSEDFAANVLSTKQKRSSKQERTLLKKLRKL